jgi:tetratricopeptide (TPR) repeat protein
MSGARLFRMVGLPVLFLALMTGCEKPDVDLRAELSNLVQTFYDKVVNDYDEADLALRKGDWVRAEKYLERFLLTEKDPEKRWQAWSSLLLASDRAGHDRRWVNEYLETMVAEFADHPERMRQIALKMDVVQADARDYDKAIVSWYQVVSLPGLPDTEKRDIYQRLAVLQRRLNRQTGAEISLNECLALPLPDAEKTGCLYTLADLKVLYQDLEAATELADRVLAVPGLDPRLHSQTNFLLADIYEQQQNYRQALVLFEEIREEYPNPLAVDERIAYLKGRLKK